MAKPRLSLVPPDGPDITMLERERILARDWSRVWIEGDKAPALFIPDRVRRPWRA
jgi:hypothetical protein